MSLYAINPDSSVRWQYIHAGILLSHIVSPLNNAIFVGGIVNYGQPGFFEALSTTGSSLWKTVLPLANGLDIVPMSRARFTPDGQTVYIGTSIPGQISDGFSYLYSVQVGNKYGCHSGIAELEPDYCKGRHTIKGYRETDGCRTHGWSDDQTPATTPVLQLCRLQFSFQRAQVPAHSP